MTCFICETRSRREVVEHEDGHIGHAADATDTRI